MEGRFTFESARNTRMVGGPVPEYDAAYRAYCPKCGLALAPHAEGSGFAYGGGYGQYMWCVNDFQRCSWFVKWLDEDTGPIERRDL